MADFSIALKKLLRLEGGYGDDPDDAGGETYRGVSRRFFPGWPGWHYIDALKPDPQFPFVLESDLRLSLAVEMLYEAAFWDRFQGAQIRSQRIADLLLVAAVNLGVFRAVEFLQRALNALNHSDSRLPSQTGYPDLLEDGVSGPKTLRAVNGNVGWPWVEELLRSQVNCYYLERVRENPSQEKFLRGWLNRMA